MLCRVVKDMQRLDQIKGMEQRVDKNNGRSRKESIANIKDCS